MQLVYRLYLLQIILLLSSVLFHGLAQSIAVVSLILTMAFLWYVLWGIAYVDRTRRGVLEEILRHK